MLSFSIGSARACSKVSSDGMGKGGGLGVEQKREEGEKEEEAKAVAHSRNQGAKLCLNFRER